MTPKAPNLSSVVEIGNELALNMQGTSLTRSPSFTTNEFTYMPRTPLQWERGMDLWCLGKLLHCEGGNVMKFIYNKYDII